MMPQISRLDGFWDFEFRSDDSAMPSDYTEQAPVPGCFDALDRHALRRGVGYYRRFFETDGRAHYRLTLGGVAHHAVVYLDGQRVATHDGAFTSFSVDLPALDAGRHELIVSADNRFDGLARSLHMDHFDWYSYGGIIRPVSLRSWSQVLIERVVPVTEDWRNGRVRIEVDFRADLASPRPLPAEIFVDDNSVYRGTTKPGATAAAFIVDVPNPRPWSPDSPVLYVLTVRIGDAEQTVDLGLRTIRSEGHRILLNDEPVRIRGVNRHESHVAFGFALPEHVILGDVQQIKDLGCNFVRTSHYPQDPRFISLCDRMGLMVWCEVTGWGYSEAMMKDKRLVEAQRACTTEMIRQYAHHPSIVCWGILNECASDAESARPVYEEMVALVRSMDPDRPVTYASNRFPDGHTNPHGDIMFDLVDWVCINAYPGWYGGDLNDCLERLETIAQAIRDRKLDEKPVVISEIGAGAIPGFEDIRPVKWSAWYQQELLQKLSTAIRDDPTWSGLCIWQFCDIRTAESNWMTRPRGYNNKGIMDELRRPKPAYRAIREIYHTDW